MADHVSMMRTPKATREYIEHIAATVWDDGRRRKAHVL